MHAKVAMVALASTLLAIPAFAQQNGQPNPGFQPNPGMMRGGPGPFGPMAMMGHDRMDMMMGAARELAAGAFFRFKRGDDEVDIHCPPNLPLQACTNAANDLMSHLRAGESSNGSSGSTSGGTSGSSSGQSGGSQSR